MASAIEELVGILGNHLEVRLYLGHNEVCKYGFGLQQ